MSAAIHPVGEPQRGAAPLNPACIACGRENPHGLRLRFENKGQMVASDWIPSEGWQGFRGVIHGGVVATVLDEAMSKAVVARGWEALTAELTIRLRKRVAPGERLTVLGMVVSKRKREIRAEASLRDGGGGERAHAWAKFLVLR